MRAAAFLDRLPETRWPVPWLVALCLLLWLPGFFTIPPGDRDESRFAQASRQMVESGDYVRIRLGEVERNKKPAGIHWAQAGVVHALEAVGIPARGSIWAYRLPSLLGALAAVLATCLLGRSLVGRRAGFVAAAMLAPCMVLVVETHIAKTDAALLASITVAMGLMGRAYLAPAAFSARSAAGFWAALGLGVLLKGPIGPMVPLLAGITLAVMDRPSGARFWRLSAPWLAALRPGWGIPLMVLFAAPWFVAINIATEGRFLAEAIGGDMLDKVGSGEEAHWGPPGMYAFIFGITAFPSAWIVIRALPGSWAERMQPAVRFLLAWAVPTWLVFEAVATKLPHYTLPAFPALMLLGARWALDPLRRAPPRWVDWLGGIALGGVAIGLPLLAGLAVFRVEGRIEPFALAGLAAGAFMTWVLVRMARRAQWGRAALAGAILVVPVYAAVLEGVIPRLEAVWLSPRLAATVAEVAPGVPPDRFGVVGHHEPSLQFAMGGGIRLLRDGADAAAFLAGGPGRIAAVNDRQEAAFRAAVAQRGLSVRELGSVTGLNYVRGRWVTLSLFKVE
ncbi:glycosyltransferase family 39 protein [Roseomonas sp. CECT 9278]|uniref:ArnT family glycosyltransferase n=1 Tax=Roseomonas sp. CECT 9278 TaxID=2845823 RepID=UPI001E428EFC|nr:phospholipid carrier-dependent glycosyltransferase [Roseomonas sp. CECT 9278]CAH0297181.1 Undecaprenyl phosphate-alpha-4-amino-4-deoxy-L-arabinose arabinosyl transferase [Roseomonas sp. CECT 9278]